MTHCMRHYEEPVMANCRSCARPFCNRCLVFPFGDDKPPMCVSCALGASGVRNSNKVPMVAAPREKVTWAERSQARSTKRALKRSAKKGSQPILGEERDSRVPVPKNLATPASWFKKDANDQAEVG